MSAHEDSKDGWTIFTDSRHGDEWGTTPTAYTWPGWPTSSTSSAFNQLDQQASSSFLYSSGCNHRHSPVLIAPTHEGMARLSWPGWLGEIPRRYNTCMRTVTHLSTNPARRTTQPVMEEQFDVYATLYDRCGQAKQKPRTLKRCCIWTSLRHGAYLNIQYK